MTQRGWGERLVMPPGAFRLGLSLAVVIHHLCRLAVGAAAVALFFVLSGCWVRRLWEERYCRCHAPLLTFYLSRAWRLLPMFVLANALAIVTYRLLGTSVAAMAAASGWPHFLLSGLFVLGSQLVAQPLILPGWSLDIEAQFYLLLPLLALLLAWMGPAAFLVGAVVVTLLANPWWDRTTLLAFVAWFALGMVGAGARIPRRLALGGVLAAVLLAAGMAVSPWADVLLGGRHQSAMHLRLNPGLNVVLALLMSPYALLTTRQRSTPRDRLLGDWSYPLYLLHWLGIVALERFRPQGLARLGWTGAAMGAALAVSLLACVAVDRPLNARRARWVRARERVPEPAAAIRAEPPGP